MSNPRIPFQLSTNRPHLPPPGGKPTIVQITVAVEYWPFDEPVPRKIVSGTHGQDHLPDVANYSWKEYGLRCGIPRLLKVLGDRGIRANACMSAGIIDLYPDVAEACLKADWEFQGHCIHQKSLTAETEAEVIAESRDKIKAFSGTPPRGWIGPGFRETFDTPDILKAAGYDYVSEWMLDDLPCWMETRHGPLIAVPYTIDLNDSMIYVVDRHTSSEQYDRLMHCLDAIDAGLDTGPRVITLPFHEHVMGVLHRIGFVAKMLDALLARDDVIFMTGGEICDWFTEAQAT